MSRRSKFYNLGQNLRQNKSQILISYHQDESTTKAVATHFLRGMKKGDFKGSQREEGRGLQGFS